MPDTFLEAHRAGPLQFAIAGPLSPISIRDQMVRAKMFIDRAIDGGLIGPTRPLFVVGAGAGGATAAVYAAQQKIPVTIIEIKDRIFGPQRQCLTRLVNPTQYDWPVDHWQSGTFPWRSPTMPLPWRAARANWIAAVWTQIFGTVLRQTPGFLTQYLNTRLVSRTLRVPQNDLEIICEVDFNSASPQLVTDHYGAALFAVGFGVEKSTIGAYKGFDFWETDNFETPRLGLPPLPLPQLYRVLICGGADGALQDFLRITTGEPSAADIWQKIRPFLPDDWQRIYSAEDQGQRANLWGDASLDHPVMMLLDHTHRTLISQLLSGSTGSILVRNVAAMLRRASGDLNITLIHTCTHFSQSYALNRFLVRLIEECAKQEGLAIRIQDRTAVGTITGRSHICAGDPAVCHGMEHEVEFRDAPNCGALGSVSGTHLFDVIVVRVGVAPPAGITGLLPLLFKRHMLPYHPPY